MKHTALLLIVMIGSACGAEIIVVDEKTTVICSMNDCSEWEAGKVSEALQDYKDHFVVLFPNEQFVAPETISVDATLPCLDFCGGYANGKDIAVQGSLDGFVMPIHMARFDHEVTHNVLRHNHNDGDSNHADAGGPWTEQHDLLVRVMERKGCDGWEAFGEPCGD